MKTCSKCGRTLPNDCFNINRSLKLGLSSACKDCIHDYWEKYKENRNRKEVYLKETLQEIEEKRKGLRELAKNIRREKDIYPMDFDYGDSKKYEFIKK